MTRYGRPQHLLESIVTSPNDEWPIQPDNEWPVRPDPEAEKALYVPPDEIEAPADPPKQPRFTTRRLWLSAGYTAVTTLAMVIAFYVDLFDGDKAAIVITWLVALVLGVSSILHEDSDNDKAYQKRLREAKPRRSRITDDTQSDIIDMSSHKDGQVTNDGEWPVLQQQAPKPTFEPYEPDKHEEFWPHVPLEEGATWFQKVRRVSWICGICVLVLLAISVYIGITEPDETFPEVQLFFSGVSAFFFCIAYIEQLFVGDH
jgi:hypothetical protein